MSYCENLWNSGRLLSNRAIKEMVGLVDVSRDGDFTRPGGEPGSPDPNGAGDSSKKRVAGTGPGIPGSTKTGTGTGPGEGSPDPPGPSIFIYNIFYILIIFTFPISLYA